MNSFWGEFVHQQVVTAGNAPDGKQLARLAARNRAQGLAVETYAASRGYDDTENHSLLMSQGLCSAIRLNRYRTEKQDANKEVWQALRAAPQCQAGQAGRYKSEKPCILPTGYCIARQTVLYFLSKDRNRHCHPDPAVHLAYIPKGEA